jgi:hypothetical protein
MVAPLGRIIHNYRALVETCQQRAIDLEISRSEIDRLAGFTAGYAGKLLGNGHSVRPKQMWPTSLDLMLGVLGLRILLIEDEAATARTLALRTPVTSSHQRFGNRSNVKSLPSIESPEVRPVSPVLPAAPPAATSRSHLRVIQNKSGRKFG